jgi:threonylcarbamoyladenosine tRNA methylthiotransferase MtaB
MFFVFRKRYTEAAAMEGAVPANVRAPNVVNARSLSVKKRRAFESQLGTQRTVLSECENKEGYIHGFTENYVKVKLLESRIGQYLTKKSLTHIDEDGAVRTEFALAELQNQRW